MRKLILTNIMLIGVLISPFQYYYLAKWGNPNAQWVVCDVFGYKEVCLNE